MKIPSIKTSLQTPFFDSSELVDLSGKPICIKPTTRTSIRQMERVLALPIKAPKKTLTPTERFMQTHPVYKINETLRKYGMTEKDLALFKEMVANEDEQFIGYNAGSSTVRLFQDMIGIIVKDILQIPIKDDFFFTRVPGDKTFHYDKASDFLNDMHTNIPAKYWDNQAEVRQHILSINMNLYQSYDNSPGNLTPRYFLENMTWTDANVRDILKPLFKSLGIDGQTVDRIWSEALGLLPHDRGYILQFFDRSVDFAFTKEHAYIAKSGGRPDPTQQSYEILSDKTATDFPQIRLVLSNESALNPFSSLEIKRYDGMTNVEREAYEASLRILLKTLSFDSSKVKMTREHLLDLWSSNNAGSSPLLL